MVDDQVGRLTFTDELARATRHLLDVGAAYGTYNVSNGGAATSWADVAQEVFELSGRRATTSPRPPAYARSTAPGKASRRARCDSVM